MVAVSVEDEIYARSLGQYDKTSALVEFYNLHLSYGATPNISYLFMTRLEALFFARESSAFSKHSVMKKLGKMEDDFQGMDYFHETLKVVRESLEASIA